MEKIQITKEDIDNFKKTENGKKKFLWFKLGIIIDIISTLSVSLLNIFSRYLNSQLQYLFIFLD